MQVQLPASYAAWAQDAKQRLLGLSPSALALLSRFLELRLGKSREDASGAANRLRLLLKEVDAALQRVEQLQGVCVMSVHET